MTQPVSIENALRAAVARLESVSDSPRLDAELLLCRAIGLPRSYLFAHPEDTLDEAALERLDATLRRRESGEPMAYISGTREFWSLELMVTPDTLVPRPETEILVDLALREIPRKAEWRVLDLGTGSGAIAIAIATERPFSRVTAVDLSKDALAVASQNARQHDLDNVEFIEGSWTGPVEGRRFDLIAANPPYVAEGDPFLDSLRAEPELALVGGRDGLDAIRAIAHDCTSIMADGAMLLVEHGSEQEAAVAVIFADAGLVDIRCHKDYALLPRVTVARKPTKKETS
ncbi:MAG: peptide chain release factor N(5)-glutamine methyltransferase [Woeseiaceae bacterium]|nr:peptide chain release factor N(5)-glutamine methyltransferase [Woeseiaceae bacterium]